ncbi:hypothetical protein DVH24_024013 [Malus domestica]|uniref:Uncharacterized protein n=1 Tax=Malus domestica TaxID=3750 RepID=A0A498JEN4_MALDO|nr:hypothetical protein DVH24_024013 [Malus domestica]
MASSFFSLLLAFPNLESSSFPRMRYLKSTTQNSLIVAPALPHSSYPNGSFSPFDSISIMYRLGIHLSLDKHEKHTVLLHPSNHRIVYHQFKRCRTTFYNETVVGCVCLCSLAKTD